MRRSAYGIVARRFALRNSKFSVPRTDPFSARRFGLWDEFRKDKNFQEFGEEMTKLRDRAEQKAKEVQDSDAWNKSTEYAESTISSTKTRFGKLGEKLGNTKEQVSEKVQSTTETFKAGEKQQTIISRFSSVKQTVYSSTSSATKRMGDATRAMGARTKEKLQFNTKIPNIGKFSNIDPEEQKRRIREMYGSTLGKTREIFSRTSGLKQTEQEPTPSEYPTVLMVEGCVGGATPCNGFYRLQPGKVEDRPVYKGPQLESGDHVTLWFNSSSSPSQWIFTPSKMVQSEEEITSLAYVEDTATNPLDITSQWHVASKRPGRYLPHAGLSVTNQLPSTPPPVDALVVYEAELSWFQTQSRKFARTKYYKNMQGRMIKMRKTESFQKISKVGVSINERVATAQTQFDESQNPMVHSIRNKIDYVSLETEHGSGINAIRRDHFPDFWPEDFLEDAESDIIPVFCKKFLEGDMTWLRLACTGDAERHCFASVKERMAQEHYWDENILWIHEPMLESVLLENKKPYVRFSFTIQHIDCSRNAKGEVVDGSPSKIANLVFVMTVTPFPENEERVGFPWQIAGDRKSVV